MVAHNSGDSTTKARNCHSAELFQPPATEPANGIASAKSETEFAQIFFDLSTVMLLAPVRRHRIDVEPCTTGSRTYLEGAFRVKSRSRNSSHRGLSSTRPVTISAPLFSSRRMSIGWE
jgi:hypothetical protein